ncbi:MAG: acyl-CoA dehydrogenase family protein [Granulosicoccus sp.]
MDFGYSTSQQDLRDTLEGFVRDKVNTRLQYPANPARFDRDLWRECAHAGLLSLGMPEPWSLAGDDTLLTMVIALEAVGYACDDNGLPFALATQACTVQQTLVQHGTEQHRAQYLPGSVRGELIGSHAMTEPQAGSDSGNISLHARKADDGYYLSGEKKMIGLAPVADYCVLFASVNPAAGRWGVTAFLIDTDSAGFEVSAPVEKMGLVSAPMGHLVLNECFVREENRIGPEGAGAAIANHSLELERICILASQVGRMQHQLELSVAHAKSRKQFGQPVIGFQAVSHRLADMKLRLETARLLLYRTAWKVDQGESCVLESSMLKLHISESFLASSMDSMRVHGGYSYIEGHETGRDTCDALGGILYAGTSDIQRNIIAGLLDL